jgi:uncharacterized protein
VISVIFVSTPDGISLTKLPQHILFKPTSLRLWYSKHTMAMKFVANRSKKGIQYPYMVDKNTLSVLKSIIKKHLDNTRYKVFIFGSRTQPKHRRFCDLDVGIMGSTELPALTLMKIKEDLNNSDIPYLTDVVDFRSVSENFKNKALSKIITI